MLKQEVAIAIQVFLLSYSISPPNALDQLTIFSLSSSTRHKLNLSQDIN